MVWNFSYENIFACRSGEHNRWVPLLFFGIFGVLIAFCNKTNASLNFFYKGHHFSFCNIYGYGLACLFWKLIISVLKVLLSINVDLTHKYVPDITCNPSLLKKNTERHILFSRFCLSIEIGLHAYIHSLCYIPITLCCPAKMYNLKYNRFKRHTQVLIIS